MEETEAQEDRYIIELNAAGYIELMQVLLKPMSPELSLMTRTCIAYAKPKSADNHE